MSYKTFIKVDGNGNIVASYHTPANQIQPVTGPGWVEASQTDGPQLLPRGAGNRFFFRGGRLVKKNRIRIQIRGRGRAPNAQGQGGVPVRVSVTGLPESLPSVRLLIGGSVVELPRDEELSLGWDTATKVKIEIDPMQVELTGDAAFAEFI